MSTPMFPAKILLHNLCSFFSALVLALLFAIFVASAFADQVTVRHTAGLIHGFLVLRNEQGDVIAEGDLSQIARGARVTSHLIFHFKDGSLNEETVVFSQRGSFRLLSDHLVQKGPAFKRSTDLSIDGISGQVVVRYTENDGKEKVINN